MTAHDSRPSVDGLSSFRARADNLLVGALGYFPAFCVIAALLLAAAPFFALTVTEAVAADCSSEI